MVAVLVIKHGRPIGITKSAREAIQITKADVYSLLKSGRQTSTGLAFDYPLDGYEYPMLQSRKDIL